MLQFLKKPGRRPSSICDAPATLNSRNLSQDDLLARLRTVQEVCLGETAPTQPCTAGNNASKSRLYLCLTDILADQNCLCYFLQYMEAAQDAVPLIKFWLAVENFRLSAQTMTVSGSEQIPQNNNNGNNCDIDDRPLTDDEKSEMQQNKEKQKQSEVKKQTNCASPPATTRSKRNSQLFQTTVATDALKILEKFLCANSDSWIDIPATIHSHISLAMGTGTGSGDAFVSPDCFGEAQKFVLDRLEREHLRRFLDSEFYCKYCLEVLTGGDLKLADILHSECALFYFMEYLEQVQGRDYLDFWMSAINFRRHSQTVSSDTETAATLSQVAAADAMVLYEKYFSLQASNPLKLSDSVRSQVEERICSTEENLLIACFDLPIRIVERLFAECYFDPFLASDLFYKHVSDLVQRSQQTPGVMSSGTRERVVRTQSLTKGHRKTNSDGGEHPIMRRSNSTVSIGSGAGGQEGTTTTTVTKLGSTVELRIDTRMFCNGDLLWNGNSNSPSSLSFGRVNALGRFERDHFDWDEGGSSSISGGAGGCGGSGSNGPGSTSGEERTQSAGARLKKAVKKLVNLTEDKVQEELAWQVAEMIVRDVTDITLSGVRGGGIRDQNEGFGGGGRNSGVMVVEEE